MAALLACVAAVFFGITMVVGAINQVNRLGGFCADGGPYQVAVPCGPQINVAFWGGAAAVLVFALISAFVRPSSWIAVVALWLPVLLVGITVSFFLTAFSNSGGGFEVVPFLMGLLFVGIFAVPSVVMVRGAVADARTAGRMGGLVPQVVVMLLAIAVGAWAASVYLP